jgi:hypothetical protein
LPAVAEVTVRVEVPDPPVMLVGLSVAVRPGDGLAVRATVPVNPLTGDTVMVAVVEAPAFTVRLVVLAVIVKSTNVKVVDAVRVRIPSVPDIVTA